MDPQSKPINIVSSNQILSRIKDSRSIEDEIKKIGDKFVEGNAFSRARKLSEILSFLKRTYTSITSDDETTTIYKQIETNATEANGLITRFKNSPQARKIFVFFQRQTILKFFIQYAIEYINQIHTLLLPENINLLISDIQLLEPYTSGSTNFPPIDTSGLPGSTQTRETNTFVDGLFNNANIKDTDIIKRIRRILDDYGILYQQTDGENVLVTKLHNGLNEIVNFLIQNAKTSPEDINKLTSLLS